MASSSAEYAEPVSGDAARLFGELDDWAEQSWNCLVTDVWYQGPDPDQDTEALLSVLELDHRCDALIASPELLSVPTRNYDRYELLAGALVVRHSVPIPADLRPPLRRLIRDDFELSNGWRQPPPRNAATAINQWQSWIRRTEASGPGPVCLSDEASLLAAGCYRVWKALRPDLGPCWQPYDQEQQRITAPIPGVPWRRRRNR
jgi:hypothetical protein